MLGAMFLHLGADDLADELRFDGYGVAAGVPTRSNAKNKYCRPELIETVDLPSRARDVLENRLGFSAIRLSHTTEIRNTQNAHQITFPHRAAVNVLNARGLPRHGT